MKNTIYILIILFFSSCVNHYFVNSAFTPENNTIKIKEKSKRVDTYYVGETIKFDYDKLGFVEITLSQLVDKSHLMDHLKYQAWMAGADAVIGINTEDVSQTYSSNIYSPLTKDNYNEVKINHYPRIKGLAVRKKILTDSSIVTIPDTTFKKTVLNDKNAQSEGKNAANRGTTLGLVLLLILGFIAIVYAVIKK